MPPYRRRPPEVGKSPQPARRNRTTRDRNQQATRTQSIDRMSQQMVHQPHIPVTPTKKTWIQSPFSWGKDLITQGKRDKNEPRDKRWASQAQPNEPDKLCYSYEASSDASQKIGSENGRYSIY